MGATPAKTPSSRSSVRDIGGFARFVYRLSGRRALLALSFLLLGSLSEGFSILLLIPLLHLVGNSGQNLAITLPDLAVFRWIAPGGTIGLSVVLCLLVALVSAQTFFNRFKSIYMAKLLFDFVNQLRIDLFESIGRAKWGIFTRVRRSDLDHALTGDVDRVQGAAYSFLILVQTLILLAGYMLISLFISPAMTVFAAAIGAVMFLLARPFRAKAARYGEVLTASRQDQSRTVSEFLHGMKVAKSLNVEPLYFARFRDMLAAMKADNIEYVRVSSIGAAMFQITSVLGLAAFVYTALVVFHLSLAEIVTLLLVFMRVAPRFMEIQTHLQLVLMNLPAFQSIQDMKASFDAEMEQEHANGAGPKLPLENEIAVRHISFAYSSNSERGLLNDVSLVLPAGQVTALIGPSGSGKSTIADLLLGLLEPALGSISVDGMELDPGNRRLWRDQVAYVPQDVFLLHDTVAANLRLAAPAATDAELWAALRSARAAEFVEKLDGGLDGVVGDRGTRLSGGERQRIALARALLRNPSLLILDEATSALDWQNQALIASSIAELRGTMTILTIAHRPSMIAFADWVVAIDQGKVVEAGTYKQLVRKSGSRLSQMLSSERPAA